ncbi:MAG: hypothetical protein Q9182_005158 [Xanthomendoza sp. 2 TL-2023]
MPTPGEPDLERGNGALKIPANPFTSTSPPSPKPAPSPNQPDQQPSNHAINRKSHHTQSATHRRRQSQHRPLSTPRVVPHDPTAIAPKLLKLRTVIGISTPDSLLLPTASSTPSSQKPPPFRNSNRPAPNLGIYTRIIHEERSAKRQFYFAASVINVCYFGQICIAAALTALGASGSSNIAITVLGAANTVLAGVLTYLKGQGLPNRLRMYWSSLRKCREFIEEKEREIEAEGWWGVDGDSEGMGMDVESVIETIVKMYHDVRQTAEDNTPDTYLPLRGSSAAALANHPVKEKRNGSVPYPDDDIYDSSDDHEGHGDEAAADGDVGVEVRKPNGSPPPAEANKAVVDAGEETGR